MAEDRINTAVQLIVIGGSAGSLEVILKIIPALRSHLPVAILIVTHRKPSNDDLLVDLLNARSNWPVKEAEEKEPVAPHCVYVAPADYHLLLEKDHTFSLDDSEKVNYSRPSIDITFEAAAEAYGPALLAILLSGANADGVDGMKRVRRLGGQCIVQDPADAEVGYMPSQAVEQGVASFVLPAAGIAPFINGLF